eukprot:m.357064 g.357064  ORF g.357064 m.357064 type:complete len:137 (-) comp28021_c0_seq8:5170-5580(-)
MSAGSEEAHTGGAELCGGGGAAATGVSSPQHTAPPPKSKLTNARITGSVWHRRTVGTTTAILLCCTRTANPDVTAMHQPYNGLQYVWTDSDSKENFARVSPCHCHCHGKHSAAAVSSAGVCVRGGSGTGVLTRGWS